LITDEAAAAAPMLVEAVVGAGAAAGGGAEVFAAAVSLLSDGFTLLFDGGFSEEAVSVSVGCVFLCLCRVPAVEVVVAEVLSDVPDVALSLAVPDFFDPDSVASAVVDEFDFFDSVPSAVVAVGALVDAEAVVAVLWCRLWCVGAGVSVLGAPVTSAVLSGSVVAAAQAGLPAAASIPQQMTRNLKEVITPKLD
jgi:hypothetical protein